MNSTSKEMKGLEKIKPGGSLPPASILPRKRPRGAPSPLPRLGKARPENPGGVLLTESSSQASHNASQTLLSV